MKMIAELAGGNEAGPVNPCRTHPMLAANIAHSSRRMACIELPQSNLSEMFRGQANRRRPGDG